MQRSTDLPPTTTLLSLVVPVFNEAESIDLFVARLTPVLAKLGDPLGAAVQSEIVFVDDGSTDRTADVITRTGASSCRVQLVRLSRNFGKDAALAAGLAHARGDAVIPMDVDLQDPPELLPQMVKAWRNGAMIVNAVRTDRSNDSWAKRRSAEAFYNCINRLTNYPVPRDVGDFRLLDRRVVDHLNTMEERIRFNKGMVAWMGYETADVPYARPAREAGTTKWKAWSLWNFALDGITGSSTLPLRIWSYIGGLLAVFAVIYAISIVIKTLVVGVDEPGYASIMVVVLTLGSANLIALGILGEYVGRISIEVRRRPLYLVDQVLDISAAKIQPPLPENERT